MSATISGSAVKRPKSVYIRRSSRVVVAGADVRVAAEPVASRRTTSVVLRGSSDSRRRRRRGRPPASSQRRPARCCCARRSAPSARRGRRSACRPRPPRSARERARSSSPCGRRVILSVDDVRIGGRRAQERLDARANESNGMLDDVVAARAISSKTSAVLDARAAAGVRDARGVLQVGRGRGSTAAITSEKSSRPWIGSRYRPRPRSRSTSRVDHRLRASTRRPRPHDGAEAGRFRARSRPPPAGRRASSEISMSPSRVMRNSCALGDVHPREQPS